MPCLQSFSCALHCSFRTFFEEKWTGDGDLAFLDTAFLIVILVLCSLCFPSGRLCLRLTESPRKRIYGALIMNGILVWCERQSVYIVSYAAVLNIWRDPGILCSGHLGEISKCTGLFYTKHRICRWGILYSFEYGAGLRSKAATFVRVLHIYDLRDVWAWRSWCGCVLLGGDIVPIVLSINLQQMEMGNLISRSPFLPTCL